MVPLFAIHGNAKNEPFNNYYYTAKKNVIKGDELYIISSGSPKPSYFLHGLYEVSGVRKGSKTKRKLLLKPLRVQLRPPSISDQPWFDPEEFRRFFARGQSMNPVPANYEPLFRNLLSARVIEDHQLDDAVDDLGSDHPDRTLNLRVGYRRDPQVRKAVLERARGKCEYCGNLGFTCTNGKQYLESHHIIALANEGEDRTTNVIALCAEDHRVAHFGRQRMEIEKEMMAILGRLHSKPSVHAKTARPARASAESGILPTSDLAR
jgi:HNH endonuclease